MGKYKLRTGCYGVGDIIHHAGDIIESEIKLDEKFKNKFDVVFEQEVINVVEAEVKECLKEKDGKVCHKPIKHTGKCKFE